MQDCEFDCKLFYNFSKEAMQLKSFLLYSIVKIKIK